MATLAGNLSNPTGGAAVAKPAGTAPKAPKAPKTPIKTKAPAKAPKAPAAPNPLAPLTPGQIRNQATKTINSSYAGALGQLNTQQSQAQNLYSTQSSDNQAFQQWLQQQATATQQKIDSTNTALTGVMQGLLNTQNAAAASTASTAANAAATAAGSTGLTPASQMAGSVANTTAQDESQAVAGNTTAGVIRGIEGQQNFDNAGMPGALNVAQGRVQQEGNVQLNNLTNNLNSIAAQRTKLTTARTGDIQKEIARLQGVEISKAQYQENQSNLAAETGIKQQSANAATANAITNQEKATTSAKAQAETARHNAAMEQINSTHYASQAAQAAATLAETNRHNQAMEGIDQQNATTKASTAGGKGAATPSQVHAITAYINELRTKMIQDIQQYGRQPNAVGVATAYHDITSGRTGISHPPGGGDPTPFLNIALNSLTQYGSQGLSQGDVDYLKSIGITNTLGYPTKSTTSKANPLGNFAW